MSFEVIKDRNSWLSKPDYWKQRFLFNFRDWQSIPAVREVTISQPFIIIPITGILHVVYLHTLHVLHYIVTFTSMPINPCIKLSPIFTDASENREKHTL